MFQLKTALISITALALAACGGGGSTSIGVSHTVSSTTTVAYVYDEPALLKASVYDSYGDRASIDDNYVAEIDPYYNRGIFEVNWSVDAPSDYYIEIAFGYSLFFDQASVVHAEYCGPYEFCDTQGTAICDYTSNLGMRCDVGLAHTDLSRQIFQLPQSGYLFISACSTDFEYCEYDTIRAKLF